MQRLAGGGHHVELGIEGFRVFVFGMDEEGPSSDSFGGMQGAGHGI